VPDRSFTALFIVLRSLMREIKNFNSLNDAEVVCGTSVM